MTQAIGILGGNFDPVHNGHLHLANIFLETLNLAEVRFVPLHHPPHRNMPVATPAQRYDMLHLAVENQEHLLVDDCELQRGGVSYTIDTLKYLRKQLGEAPLCLFMGIDNFKTLDGWHQWQSLIEYAHIVVARRPGTDDTIDTVDINIFLDRHMTESISDLHRHPAGHIIKLELPMLDISSTQIRNNFQTDLKSASLLPDKVLDFIHSHHLYQT